MTAIDNNLDPDQILKSDTLGMVCCAVKGTTPPTDPSDLIESPFKAVGIISDDGISTSYKRESTAKNGWNVRGVVARIPKTAGFTFKFTAMQTNDLTHELYYGAKPTVIGSTDFTRTPIKAKSDVTEYVWLLVFPWTNGEKQIYVVPEGIVTDTEDLKVSEEDVPQYGLTVEAQAEPGIDEIAYILNDVAAITGAA